MAGRNEVRLWLPARRPAGAQVGFNLTYSILFFFISLHTNQPYVDMQKTHNTGSAVSLDMIHYIVMCVGQFARRFNLTRKEAFNYINRFKGLEFVLDNYEVEHQLSLAECVDDMAAICRQNGGKIE